MVVYILAKLHLFVLLLNVLNVKLCILQKYIYEIYNPVWNKVVNSRVYWDTLYINYKLSLIVVLLFHSCKGPTREGVQGRHEPPDSQNAL